MAYENKQRLPARKNKPKTNPIQTQFKPKQTQNKPKQTQFKPNTNPIKPNFPCTGDPMWSPPPPISPSLPRDYGINTLYAIQTQFPKNCFLKPTK